MTVQTVVGKVTVVAAYGKDPETGEWLSPVRVVWGLGPHETMSPVLEERLCYTATQTLSYEKASRLATKWGTPTDDSAIYAHVQKRGQRAMQLEQQRCERALSPETRGQVVAEAKRSLPPGEFSMVIMMDGTMLRERGPDWGLKPADIKAERVAWHELKGAVIYRLHERVETQSGRGMILEKFTVAYRGDPYEFGRRVYAEALRRGLNQAKHLYVVADGGVWIWNLVADRFPQAKGGLDFSHASHHLWAVAHDHFGQESHEAQAWVEPLLHQLKHGGEAGVLQTLDDLLALCAETGAASHETVKREAAYFHAHKDHIHYEELALAGCPIGSGTMESTCGQLQDRFKRTGQFWTLPGEQHLMALELAQRNNDWDEIWELN